MICKISFSQQSDYFIIPTQTHNTYKLLGDNSKKNYKQTIHTFEITKQILLKEYNRYLADIKKNTTTQFYKSQLPDTSLISKKSTTKYLRNIELQDEPIVGVSWESAINFCKWKTLKENKTGEIKFIYRLPYCSEWLFSQYFLQNSGIENDFNKKYSDWLLNTKDESNFSLLGNFSIDYTYFALENDLPVLKRKVIIGNSFLFNQPRFFDYFLYSYYSFSGYPQTGFRCIKIYLNDSIISNKYSTENSLLNLWNISLQKKPNQNRIITSLIKDSVFVEYQINNNLLNGYYFSKFKNGQIKATGHFVDNMKVGIWSVWDSSGVLKNQRYYYNSFEYQPIFPLFTGVKTTKYISYKRYKVEYNSDNYISYFNLTERMIFDSETIWRNISKSENHLIFNENILELLYNEIKNNTIICYLKEFTDTIKIQKLPLIDTISLVGIRFKEDWFFDTERFIFEKRIISFIPRVKTRNSNDTIDLGIIYFPELRKSFAKLRIKSNKQNIKTIDDLFFFNYFYGIIYQRNGKNKIELIDYKKNNYDLYLIERENDIISDFN